MAKPKTKKHFWHKSINRMHDGAFTAASPVTRAIVYMLEELLSEREVISANLNTLAGLLAIRRNNLLESLTLISDEGWLDITHENHGKLGQIFTIRMPSEAVDNSVKSVDNPVDNSVDNFPKKVKGSLSIQNTIKSDQNTIKSDQNDVESRTRESSISAPSQDLSLNESLFFIKKENKNKNKNAHARQTISISMTDPSVHPETESIAQELAEAVARMRGYRPAVTVQWIDTIHLLLAKDGKTADEIRGAIAFAEADDFWRGVICDPRTLRKNVDKLIFSATSGRNKKRDKNVSDDAIAAFLARRGDDQ